MDVCVKRFSCRWHKRGERVQDLHYPRMKIFFHILVIMKKYVIDSKFCTIWHRSLVIGDSMVSSLPNFHIQTFLQNELLIGKITIFVCSTYTIHFLTLRVKKIILKNLMLKTVYAVKLEIYLKCSMIK